MTPVVSVPVLSRTTARIRPADSSAWALLTKMPSSAPRPTAASSAVGVARPSAHGQATTSTATAALQAAAAGRPVPSQNPRVATAQAITHGTNTAAIRSASRCALALVPSAWLTRRVICASSVSEPTRVARTTSRPLMFTVAPVTWSPGSHLGRHRLAGDQRGVDRGGPLGHHPVGGDLLPRAGRRTGPRPRARPPAPAARSRPAAPRPSWRPSAARADKADPDRTRARASRYLPASTAVVTPAAASRYRVCPLACPKVNANDIRIPAWPAPPNSSAYSDQPNDAATPTLTSVSIVAAAWPRPSQAARCSGHAPQIATGAASSRLTHCQPVNCAAGTMASTMTAAASGMQTTSRQPRARATGSEGGLLAGRGRHGQLGGVAGRGDDADQLAGVTAAQAG